MIREATSARLEALAITDHDTFAGYEAALPFATAAGLDLIQGIELSTKFHGAVVHLLAYFLHGTPGPEFSGWLFKQQESRRDRNRRLIDRLRELGIEISLEEVEAIGRSLTGRPHFARILVRKGFATDLEDAFSRYLGEDAIAYVDREDPPAEEAVRLVLASGGIPSVAHPIRLRDDEQTVSGLAEHGLPALEVYHSDHNAASVQRYEAMARRFGLLATGGSDFHGTVKPHIRLGSGMNGNLRVPKEVLDRLRAL